MLDANNLEQKIIIDRLKVKPEEWTAIIIKELPDQYKIYKDPITGDLYYSWDDGQSFTRNPGNPYDTAAHPAYDVAKRLKPYVTTAIKVEYKDEITETISDVSEGYTISTQERAQRATVAINEAIVSKDKIRAHLGAAQNRLENTVSHLNIQAENLQMAESRISDVDMTTEMTQFVRNQILTQSAVAMLSQANSMPQMVMQLIGG